MKQHILPAIRLTAVCIVLLLVIYPAVIFIIGKLSPGKGEGETVHVNGRVVGYALEGQSFTQDKYFNGRPSAVNYNAAGSAGSNKGPSNPDYLKELQNRIDTILVHNPSIKKEDIPSDMITASGSGLDPDISLQAARIQVNRIAAIRKIEAARIMSLVDNQTEHAINGIQKINVLRLNIALDEIK